MKYFDWDDAKNAKLRAERGIGFEEIGSRFSSVLLQPTIRAFRAAARLARCGCLPKHRDSGRGHASKAGLIKYHRGHVTVVDREDLEAASCVCHRVATDLLNAVTDGSRA